MRQPFHNQEQPSSQPRFYSVAEAAKMFGMSTMTLYRAIHDGEFPAIRIRGRLIIPAKAVDDLSEAAVRTNTAVDAADWNLDGADE